MRLTGGCVCGDVRIVASGAPYRVGLCHCLDCRKHHGALFHASAIYPEDAVTVEGETRDYAGRFFLSPLRLSCFWTQRRRNRSEPRIARCPQPAGADLRTLETVRREAWLPPFPVLNRYDHDRDATSRFET